MVDVFGHDFAAVILPSFLRSTPAAPSSLSAEGGGGAVVGVFQ